MATRKCKCGGRYQFGKRSDDWFEMVCDTCGNRYRQTKRGSNTNQDILDNIKDLEHPALIITNQDGVPLFGHPITTVPNIGDIVGIEVDELGRFLIEEALQKKGI